MAQGDPIIFSATGDVPYDSSEVPIFQQQISDHNLYSPSEFFIHLGDIKKQSDPCDESAYSDVADYLMDLAVPVFIVPGDNETTDCKDQEQAWRYWEQYFIDFELNFCGAPVKEKQAVRPENFAFISKGVLFIGINLVTGVSSPIMNDDADWVEQQFQEKVSQVRGAVIFSQCGPDSSRSLFFNRFVPAAQAFAKPILFLHGDGHSWIKDYPFTAPNVLRVQVNNGGDEEPVQITVTTDPQDMFVFLRNPFSNNPQLYNLIPCVDAGADQQINLTSAANLEGRATDDGVPTSPGTLTTTWSKISGPGIVTFANPNDLTTSASFSLAGTYLLRLTADDGELQNYDELMVEVGVLTVISPNGGETWQGGSVQDITWSSVGTSGTVKIEYSTDNGLNWGDIAATTTDDGSEPWNIPDSYTTKALIRISDTNGSRVSDKSDAVFTIIPASALISVFQDGTTGYSGTRDTDLMSSSPGTNFWNITPLELDGHPKDKSTLLSWDLTDIPVASILLGVQITVDVTHLSSNTYELYQMKRAWIENEATWNEYASGLNWNVPGADDSQDRGSAILGTITPSNIGSTTIVLNEAGVAMVQSWVNDPSSNHGFIVMNYDNINQAEFSSREAAMANRPKITVIYAPKPILVVTSPNGGEIWEGGSTQYITWGSVGTSGTVNIEYSADNGSNWSDISSGTSDDGIELWNVPDTTTVEALVRISDTAGNGTVDISDTVFTITPTPTVTVTSPNGGETWEGGTTQSIIWNSVGTSGTVRIEYSLDNGLSWSDGFGSTSDDGTEPWIVPNVSTTKALVRVSDADGNGPFDTSDTVFTITPTPMLTVTSPNGGETWERGSTETISWSSTGGSGTVKIEFSTDAGLNWSDVFNSTSDDGVEPWIVPDTSTTQALVRISDTDGNGPADISDTVFTIMPAPTDITSNSLKIPAKFQLHQNYPNPFNPATTIRFDIPITGSGFVDTRLVIYNSLGQEIKTLYQGKLSTGSYWIQWDGTTDFGHNAPSGIYFIIFKANEFSQVRKLVLLR